MKKFKTYIYIYIYIWLDGKQVRSIKNVPPETIWECVYIYNSIIQKEKPSFINGKVKEILDKCGINTVTDGIRWRIV